MSQPECSATTLNVLCTFTHIARESPLTQFRLFCCAHSPVRGDEVHQAQLHPGTYPPHDCGSTIQGPDCPSAERKWKDHVLRAGYAQPVSVDSQLCVFIAPVHFLIYVCVCVCAGTVSGRCSGCLFKTSYSKSETINQASGFLMHTTPILSWVFVVFSWNDLSLCDFKISENMHIHPNKVGQRTSLDEPGLVKHHCNNLTC